MHWKFWRRLNSAIKSYIDHIGVVVGYPNYLFDTTLNLIVPVPILQFSFPNFLFLKEELNSFVSQ